MTQPPYEPEPPERPQDVPHDPTRSFPTYGRSGEPTEPLPTGTPTEPLPTQPPTEHAAGTSWAAPGQQSPYGQSPYQQQSPYGQGAPSQGQPGHGQPSYGQAPYGQAQQGQPPYGPSAYGQAPYGQAQQGQPPYGPSAYGQAPYGQAPQGQPPYGQPAYGQAPYGHGYGPGQYPAAYGQPPAAYGYGYTGGSGGTNSLATAALVSGLGGIVIGVSAPVAVGLGIAALVQISRRPQQGKGMAIAGIIIGALVTLGYIALIALVIAFGSSTDTSGAPGPGSSSVYVDELAVGDCFDETSVEDEVIQRDCPVEHDGEMVASVTLPAGAYPGDKAIDDAADQACAGPFGTYVGKSRDESELELAWWTPDKRTWNSGDRRVLCAAYGPGTGKLTGTVKNSHR
ncbi:DUF4190 domain-containing protein [Kribbella sp. GL6]|uniref:DUF4190 domain-containing protein n=1 Tax=Kribbella sp. GL6 TaxID=3419765 RepID=UPI003D02D0B5